MEKEKDGKLPFMDVNVLRTSEGQLHFEVYRKPTYTGRYLRYTSNQPGNVKKAVAMSLFHRVSYATDASAKETELKNVKTELKKNGYSENVIKQARKEVKNRNIGANRKQKDKSKDERKSTVVIPYVQGVSERVRKVLGPLGLATAMQSQSLK